jgi:dTDP-4-dehydrorhamnose 3,5-epimerase
MRIITTSIPDVVVIESQVYRDDRGFFMEIYHANKFKALGITDRFVQDNYSGSYKGTLRGLHYQIKHPQGKLVRVIGGEIFDVAVDLRRGSSTFGKWVSKYLSAENKLQLWVPQGFAHGFYVLSDWAEVLYKVTDFYHQEWDRTLIWNDPKVGITWPIEDGESPILSDKDAQGKTLDNAEVFN